jgi:hypothetical protein
MAGKAQLPNQEHIKSCPERSSYFVRDWDAPAWQRQHDDITTVLKLVEVRRQLNPGVAAIAIGLSFTRE